MPHDARLPGPTQAPREVQVTAKTFVLAAVAAWLIAFAAVLWMFLTMSSARPPREPGPRAVAVMAFLVGLGGGWAIRLLVGS